MSILLLFCLSLLAVGAYAEVGTTLSYDEAIDVIQEDLEGYGGAIDRPLCDRHTCCNMTETNSCGISSMSRDSTTLVLPGGETRCILDSSTPYAFEVIPGDSDKLLFFFQGGGACWDKTSTNLRLCSLNVNPEGTVGVMNRDDERNSFKSYTVVYALYCSGDVWGGDSTRPYTNYKGESVVQKGLANAQATLDWVVQQQASGALAETFSELVVMGCSAGSIGTQLWGKQILDTLKWKQAAIVPDSYVGVFPEGVIGQLIYNFGFCSSGFLSPELYAKCMAQQLTLTDINLEFIAQNPSVPYGFVQSKVDIVQQAFYIAVAFTTNTTDQLISPTEFYESVTDIFSTYNNKLSNFVTYLVDGLQHCFTNRYYFFTADGYGPLNKGKTNTQPMLYDWLDTFPMATGDHIDTVCEGKVIDTDAKDEESTHHLGANTYCSDNLYPKDFQETR